MTIKPDTLTINRRIKMRKGGMTLQEIADTEGVTRQTIHEQLQKYIPNANALETYKKHRADILAAKQIELLQSLTADKIKEASALQLITGMGILTDKERLERGQSTANLASHSLVEQIEHDRQAMQEELRKLRGETSGAIDVTPESK